MSEHLCSPASSPSRLSSITAIKIVMCKTRVHLQWMVSISAPPLVLFSQPPGLPAAANIEFEFDTSGTPRGSYLFWLFFLDHLLSLSEQDGHLSFQPPYSRLPKRSTRGFHDYQVRVRHNSPHIHSGALAAQKNRRCSYSKMKGMRWIGCSSQFHR